MNCNSCNQRSADFYRRHDCGWAVGICARCASGNADLLKEMKTAAVAHAKDCLGIESGLHAPKEVQPDVLEHILRRLGLCEERLGL